MMYMWVNCQELLGNLTEGNADDRPSTSMSKSFFITTGRRPDSRKND